MSHRVSNLCGITVVLFSLCGVTCPIAAADCNVMEMGMVNVGMKDAMAIENLERRWAQAYAERNVALLQCIIADDFEIGSMPDKKVEVNGKQHVLDWVPVRTGSTEIEQLHVKLHREVAIARGSYVVRAQDGMVRERFQFTDLFVYRGHRWQALVREIAELPFD